MIGCNAVTRHDAAVSVRAGFLGNELSALWPDQKNWQLTERRTGLFSHLFVAQKIQMGVRGHVRAFKAATCRRVQNRQTIQIVGGGLAGLTLGIALRKSEIPVTIWEAGHYPRHRVCGEFISGRGLEVLDVLGS